MSDGILVINAGSSSIKFSLYVAKPGGDPVLSSKGQMEGIGVAPHFIAKSPAGQLLAEQRWDKRVPHDDLFGHLLEWIEGHLDGAELKMAGHRVVHGGRDYTNPVLVDRGVLQDLELLIPLAPLHQSHNLDPIRTLGHIHPGLPQVACFDTSFHRTNPRLSTLYALPRWLVEEGVLRYGFHGLSYEYISHRLKDVAPDLARGKVVVCHLGNGTSMCAIQEGRSVTHTLGFTAVEGLPMGTRSGILDPGVILYLIQQKGMDAYQIEKMIYKESGLLGLSGVSSDMRELMESADPNAKEAVDFFIYRIAREMGSLAAAMGGLDGVVFTAGIGEHSPYLRSEVIRQSAWLGLEIDEAANQSNALRISPEGAKLSTWVIPTDEELMIAMHTRRVVGETVTVAAQ